VADVIEFEYKANVAGLKAELKGVQKDLKDTENAGIKAGDNTTKAIAKTEGQVKSLKGQLRDLKEAQAKATDPKEYERLSKAVGKLTDQIEDAGDAARIFASESKFEQIGSALGSVGAKLRNLDFKGAADQSKLLVSVSKSLTFKEALGGVKDFGSTLFNIGKSLLMNPIFLIGAAVIGIVANFDKLKNSGGLIGTVFSFIGDVIDGVITAFQNFTDLIGLTDIASQKFVDNQIKQYAGLTEAIKQSADREIAIRKAAGESTLEIEKKKLNDIIESSKRQITVLNSIERAGRELTDEQKKQREDAINDAVAADTQLRVNAATEQKRIEDEYKKHLERLRALRTGNITSDYEREKQIVRNNFADGLKTANGNAEETRELKIKLTNELNEVDKKYFSDLIGQSKESVTAIQDLQVNSSLVQIDINAKLNSELLKQDEEAEKKRLELKKRLQSEYFAFLGETLSTASQINSNIAERQIQEANDVSDAEVQALQNQYDQNIISKEEFERRKQGIDKKTADEERKIKQKQFEVNRQIALIQVIINTAQAVSKTIGELGFPAAIPFVALAAATGALQTAAILSQPTPKFAKGVVDLQGDGTGTSDSIHAMLSKGESVITAKETYSYKDLLLAINKGSGHKYIEATYIAPALKAQRRKYEEHKDRSFADNLMRSMTINQSQFRDSNILDSLKQSRKMEKENILYLAKVIESTKRSKHKW
jgi:hypothetical protein